MFMVSLADHETARAETVRSLPATMSALAEEIFRRLRLDDVELSTLTDQLASDPASCILYWHTLNVLALAGNIETLVVSADEVLLTASGVVPAILPPPPPASRRLSRLATIRAEGPNLIVESPHGPGLLTLVSDKAATFCAALARGTTATWSNSVGVHDAVSDELVVCFAAIRALADDAADAPAWEHHDALFHARTRGRMRGRRGGTYRFRGERSPMPAAPKRAFGDALRLPPASVPVDLEALNRITLRRRSVREGAAAPMDAGQLGNLLRSVSRTLEIEPVDEASGRLYETTRRPYPGGGACHELEFYPIVHRCEGLARGAYWYDGVDDSVRLVAIDSGAIDLMLDRAGASMGISPNRPDVLISISARFGRVNWKYEGIAYALVLKDLGVALHALYLASTAAGLGGCAVGIGDSQQFGHLTGLPWLQEDAVGEFALMSMP
jgi:SagB-type dehydrogenase family enzyme